MTLCDFKDMVFDTLNETDRMEIYDLELLDRKNILFIQTADGSCFEIVCRQIEPEQRSMNYRMDLGKKELIGQKP